MFKMSTFYHSHFPFRKIYAHRNTLILVNVLSCFHDQFLRTVIYKPGSYTSLCEKQYLKRFTLYFYESKTNRWLIIGKLNF